MSGLSSVKKESIEFAKRHFNGSSNGFVEGDDDDDIERDPHAYDDAGNSINSDNERAFSGLGSSNIHVKTDLSFEDDLACFPIS